MMYSGADFFQKSSDGTTRTGDVRQQVADQIKADVAAALQAARDQAAASGDQVTAAKLDEALAKMDGGARVRPQTGSHTEPPDFRNFIPPQAVDIVQALGTTLVFCVVGFPLARAFARWIDRRGATPPVPREVIARLESIEKAVENVAVEMERVSEGQRFTSRLLNERAHEPAPQFGSDRDAPGVPVLPSNARRS